MDPEMKKTALRMIPYGIYVLTAKSANGDIAAATVNWVTQTSFDPPLLVVGMKADSGAYAAVKESGTFNLNMLGKGQQGAAFAFFKPAEMSDGKLSGHDVRDAANGVPVLNDAPAHVQCTVAEIIEKGDHHIVVGQVANAHVGTAPAGRADEAILEMKDLGEKVFYGG